MWFSQTIIFAHLLSSDTNGFHAADSLNDLSCSLFESLRELIYSEVASLISQNETRPHYLVELFRKLQLMTTGDQRRQVMALLDQLVADYLTDSDDQPPSTELHRAGLQHSVSCSIYRAVDLTDD